HRLRCKWKLDRACAEITDELGEPRDDALAAENHEHFEETRTHGTAGHCNARGVDERACFHAASLGNLPQCAFGRRLIEDWECRVCLRQRVNMPGQCRNAKVLLDCRQIVLHAIDDERCELWRE